MLNFWKSTALIIALAVLTGCSNPPKTTSRVTPLATTSREAPSQRLPLDADQGLELTAKPAGLSSSNDPASQISLPLNEWISWEQWSQRNGLEPPRRLDNGLSSKFQSRSPNGFFLITMGSRVAYWNGLAVALGFVPHLTNGHPFLHGLDVMKNIAPLVSWSASLTNHGRVIVIDPGHGGENTGANCVLNGGWEKDYTLDWALRVKPLLQLRGWEVFLTRASDVDVSLAERVRCAERVKADLFVSLHFNAVDPPASGPGRSGLETYCLTPAGMPSSLTRDFDDDPSLTYPNNAFDMQNLQYAVRLHQAIVQVTQRNDRGIRRARFMAVLREQNRPAVLLEGGYLSDPQEARLIASAAYRQKLAEAVARALE